MNVRTLRRWLGPFSPRGAGRTSGHEHTRSHRPAREAGALGLVDGPNETGERTPHRRRELPSVLHRVQAYRE